MQINLEPPIIKPPGVTSFDDESVVPGEEEIMVPLEPPVTSAPDTDESADQAQSDKTDLGTFYSCILCFNFFEIRVNFKIHFVVNGKPDENGEVQEKSAEQKLSEGEEDEDDDDNINVVIGDIRTTPSYNSNLHIKRGNLLTLTKVSLIYTLYSDRVTKIRILNKYYFSTVY